MLLEKIKTDQKMARIMRDHTNIALLTTLIGDIEMVGKNAGREATDDEVVAIIKKFIKNILEFLRHAPDNLKLMAEQRVLESYLPKQLTEIEIKNILESEFGTINKNNKGIMMKFLKENYVGKYDGATASKVIG